MVHALTGTLAIPTALYLGRGPARHPFPPSQVTPSHLPSLQWVHTQLCHTEGRKPHSLDYINSSGKYCSTIGGAKSPLAPYVSLCTLIGAFCGKFNFGKCNIFYQKKPCCFHGECLFVLIHILCVIQFTQSLLKYIKLILNISSNLMSGMPSNAGPFSETTKNLQRFCLLSSAIG